MSDPITDFIRARLAEDQAVVSAALAALDSCAPVSPEGAGPPLSRGGRWVTSTVDGDSGREVWVGQVRPEILAVTLRWDLRRSRASTAITEVLLAHHVLTEGGVCETCLDPDESTQRDRAIPARWPCPTITACAWQWSDHPDFDQAWSGPL